jgi:PHD-finger
VPWTACAGCWNGDDPKRIVICEGCEVEYHTYCLNPPLDEVRLISGTMQSPTQASSCSHGTGSSHCCRWGRCQLPQVPAVHLVCSMQHLI